MQEVLTVPKIAQEKGVALSTVRAWCDSGELPATNVGSLGKRKEWRVTRGDLDAFWASRSNAKPKKEAPLDSVPNHMGQLRNFQLPKLSNTQQT